MTLVRILLGAVLIYASLLAVVWLFQGRLLYLPSVGGREITATPADIGLEYEDVALVAEDGVELHAWYVPGEPARGTLLFFHGNAGNISHRLDSIALFRELGLSVFIMDYRGYGESGGSPSEAGTALDARAAWQWLVDEAGHDPDRLVIFGRSLGAAVAAELARDVSAGAVMLESPFRSVPEIGQEAYPFLPARWLSRFEYATEEYVRDIAAPLLVIHSEDDEIIPFAHGRAVYHAAAEPRSFLAIRGGHNTGFIESRGRYMSGMDAFLREHGFP